LNTTINIRKNSIILPRYVTDIAIESFYKDIIQFYNNSDKVIWDFGQSHWVELTSLFRILSFLNNEMCPQSFIIKFRTPDLWRITN